MATTHKRHYRHDKPYQKQTGQWVPQVWCSIHDCHPDECWHNHVGHNEDGGVLNPALLNIEVPDA